MLWVGGSGYRKLTRTFTVDEMQNADIGTYIALDIFIPNAQKNPWWVGDVQLFWNVPEAGIFSQYLGRVDLTPLPRGNFSTVSFALTENVQSQLRFGPGNVTFTLALNGDGGFALDNFRMTNVLPESFPSVRATARILAMDNIDDWSSEYATLWAATDRPNENRPVLHIQSSGWSRIVSAEFDQSVIQRKREMALDLKIPVGGNAHWAGSLAASLDCPAMGVYSLWLGQISFQDLPKNEWKTILVNIPESAASSVTPAVGCRLFLDLNSNGPENAYQLDKIRFID